MSEVVKRICEKAHRIHFGKYADEPMAYRSRDAVIDLEDIAKDFTDWNEWNHFQPMQDLGFVRIEGTNDWSMKLPNVEVIWKGGTRFLYTNAAMVKRNEIYGSDWPAQVEVDPHPVTLGDVKFLLWRLGRSHA